MLFCITKPEAYNLLKKKLFTRKSFYYFARFSRLHNYQQGIDNRLKQVCGTYGIDKTIIKKINGRVVVDIGANIGEFSIALREHYLHLGKIICIEPDPWDFSTLKKNADLFDFLYLNCAIGTENKTGFLSDDNFDANSRLLLEHEDTESAQLVEVKTLNKVLSEFKIDQIGLVKIEAEGFEPEILLGIDFSTINIQFFVIDCGPERPPNNSNTVVFCVNYLKKFGYELKNFNHQRISIIMEKT